MEGNHSPLVVIADISRLILFYFWFILKTVFQVSQNVLRKPRMTLNILSFCLYVLSVKTTGVHHHAQVSGPGNRTQGFVHAR